MGETSDVIDIAKNDLQSVERIEKDFILEVPGVKINLINGDMLLMYPISLSEFEQIEEYIPFGAAIVSSLHSADDIFGQKQRDLVRRPTYKADAIEIGP